jgi:enoyl-CoA hydratase/carnithine racemase
VTSRELSRPAVHLDELATASVASGAGPLVDSPIVLVALDGRVAPDTAAIVRTLPQVVVGVGRGSSVLGDDERRALDVVLREGSTDDVVDPAVVTVADLEAALDRLAHATAASPEASVALVQLLRAGEDLSAAQAVIAESWVYSMLQAGSVHRAWLAAGRGPAHGHAPERARSADAVRAQREGNRLDLVLSRPEVRNAVDRRVRDDLHDALAVAALDPGITEVHLWGDGPAFCSGGDLLEFGTAPDPPAASLVRTTRSPALDLRRVADRLTVHVHGAAVGAGVEWAAVGTRVVARRDATFRLPEVSMGLVPGAGGTSSIPRRIGRHRATWMALTGDVVDAARALAWRLVDELVDAEVFGGPPRARGRTER